MGWSVGDMPTDLKRFLRELLTWDGDQARHRCVDIAIKVSAAYAAVETIDKETGDKSIWAAVIMLRRYGGKDARELGYKLVGEDSGPVDTDCPKRILDLLTDTNVEYAKQWRARCLRTLDKRKKSAALKPGQKIEYAQHVRFTDGYEGRSFTVVSVRGRRGRTRKVLRGDNGCLYRMPNMRQRSDWSLVEEHPGG